MSFIMTLRTNGIMTIGALVERYGVAAQSLRNWERAGLIPPARRTPGGHRRYGAEHVAALDQLFDPLAPPRDAAREQDYRAAAQSSAGRVG